jgi:hypothetical protein
MTIMEAPDSVFVIETEAHANWALDKILAARAVAAYRKEAAVAWVAEAEREVKALEEQFLPQLRVWAKQNLPQGKKTVLLRAGTMAFRHQSGRYVLEDPERALAWARQCHPAAVKEAISLSTIQAYATQTGEVPDGVKWEQPTDDSFSIR